MEMQTHSQDILAYQITAGTVTELSQQTELTDLLPSSRQALQQLAPHCSTKDLQQAQLEDNTTGPIAGKTDLPKSDGLVYSLWETPAGDSSVWQLLLPKK